MWQGAMSWTVQTGATGQSCDTGKGINQASTKNPRQQLPS